MGKEVKEHVVGAALVSLVFMVAMWAFGSLGFSGLSLSFVQWLAGTVLIFVLAMYLSLGFASSLALSADNKLRAPGGHSRGDAATFIVAAVVLGALIGAGIFWWASSNKATSAQSVSSQYGEQPATPTSTPSCSYSGSMAQTQAKYSEYNNSLLGYAVATYSDSKLGKASPLNNTLTAFNTTDIYFAPSGYYTGALVSYTAPCGSPAGLTVNVKLLDSALATNAVVENNDGTRNAYDSTNTAYANQTIGASGGATFTLKLKPNGLGTHLSGPTNKFAVYLGNVSNSSQYDTSASKVSFQGVDCTPDNVFGDPAAAGGIIINRFICTGDFSGKDYDFYPLKVTIKMASGKAAGNWVFNVGIAAVDYFTTSQAVTLAGVDYGTGGIALGPVTDAKAAIHTLQWIPIQLK